MSGGFRVLLTLDILLLGATDISGFYACGGLPLRLRLRSGKDSCDRRTGSLIYIR
jgi:hypothetical protein